MASPQDKFLYPAGRGALANLADPGHIAGGKTISITSNTDWNPDSLQQFSMFTIDPTTKLEINGTYTEWVGILNGLTIDNMSLTYGTDQDYQPGENTVVVPYISKTWADKLITGLLVSHNFDGSLKQGAVTDQHIQNSSITAPKLATASVTPDKLSLGANAQNVNIFEKTTSTSWANLSTPGPAVTVTIGVSGLALIAVSAVGHTPALNFMYISLSLSGANTMAAGTQPYVIAYKPANSANDTTMSASFLLIGLNPGLTTFALKYCVADPGMQASFHNRHLGVVPL